MPNLYTFSEYSSDWPAAFEQEATRLRDLLGALLVAVHHIGSTSVPGLAAKPIIDMLPVVRDIDVVEAYTPQFEAAGYQVWGEHGLPGRRYFTKNHNNYRTHNIHIYQTEDLDIERHLAFCAFLREHDAIRDAYAALKREVYARYPADIEGYCEGKDVWIKQIETKALTWYRQQKG